MTEHPARVHGLAVALVAHFRRRDTEALWLALQSLTGEQLAEVNMALVALCARVLDDTPEPDRWLNAAALHLAQADGDPLPPANPTTPERPR